MNDAIKDLQKEATKVELKRLYNSITKLGIEELKICGDKFPSAITVILSGKILVPLLIGPEKSGLGTLANILKNEKVSALIVIAKGWAVRPNGGALVSFSLNHHPGSEEIFFAGIESVEMIKTRIWKMRRDGRGKIIFPLGRPEVFLDDEAFTLRVIKNSHYWAGNGHEIYYA